MHSLRASVPFILFAAIAFLADRSHTGNSFPHQGARTVVAGFASEEPTLERPGDQTGDKKKPATKKPTKVTRIVKATAYNALPEQTDSTPEICAWGDRVRPGIIAISIDLERIGLTRGKEVHIEGFGKAVVLDRMHNRKRNQIDLFMTKYEDALKFGVQDLMITWTEEG